MNNEVVCSLCGCALAQHSTSKRQGEGKNSRCVISEGMISE